jgi:hypothetical protein
MDSKVCCICRLVKGFDEFHKNKSKKDGLQDLCKECRKLNSEKNKSKLSEYKKEWYKKNSDLLKKRSNIRHHTKKEDINKKRREKYNIDETVRDKYKEQRKNYYKNNKDTITKNAKIWGDNNKEKRNEISKKHYNKYKTLMICRRLIKRTIKYLGTEKELSTIELLGYSPLLLKERMESKFTKGMTWENYGEWHIDHIRPISSFDKDESPSVINSINNLQPLWAFENLSKGSKYEDNISKVYQ